jgi:hypothetical protein
VSVRQFCYAYFLSHDNPYSGKLLTITLDKSIFSLKSKKSSLYEKIHKTLLARKVRVYMKKCIIFFLTLFILLQSQLVSATEYSRNAEFGPARFTVEQITKISNDLFSYIGSVNNPAKKTTGTIEFKSDKYSSSFDLPILPADYDKIPDYSHTFTFRANSYGNNLSSVIIQFGDSYRYANVSGLNHSHVTGFLSIVQDKIKDHEVTFAGSKFRIFLAVVYWIFLFIAYILVTRRYENLKVFVTALVVFIVLLNGVIFLFPWDRIFPGTLITHNKLSFLEENSYIFTFFGFLLALIPVLWPIVMKTKKKLKRIDESRDNTPSA